MIQGQNWLNLLQFLAENVLNWVKWFWVNSRLSKYGECSILSSDTWCKGLTSNWANLFPDKSNVFKLVKDWQNSNGKYEISLWAKSRCSSMDPNAWKKEHTYEVGFFLKFGLYEKHTKFEKIFLMVLTNRLIYLVNFKTMRMIAKFFVVLSEKLYFTDRQILGIISIWEYQS